MSPNAVRPKTADPRLLTMSAGERKTLRNLLVLASEQVRPGHIAGLTFTTVTRLVSDKNAARLLTTLDACEREGILTYERTDAHFSVSFFS